MRSEHVVATYSDHILFPIELVDDKGESPNRSIRRARCGSGRSPS